MFFKFDFAGVECFGEGYVDVCFCEGCFFEFCVSFCVVVLYVCGD